MRWLVFWIGLSAAAQPRVPTLVNGDVQGLAAPPSFAVHPGGRITFAWSVYEYGQERMVSTVLEARGLSRPMELSPGPGLHSTPVVVATGPRSGWLFWMRQRDGRWQIMGREWRDGVWLPVAVLAGERGDALFPAAAVSSGSVTLAWEDHASDPQRIAMRRWDGRAWSGAEWVSGDRLSAYRPAAAGTAGSVWVLWDEYSRVNRAYSVHARRMRPSPGADETVSPAGANCLKAAVLALGGDRLAAAWVNDQDARGGDGIVDHQDSVQVALRRDSGWAPVRSAAGSDRAAWLRHGLLPFLEPSFRPVSGYSGFGRRPMLAAIRGAPWLLWERKSIADGPSWVPGQLCGARLDGATLTAPVILHEGLVEYQAASGEDALLVVGRTPQHGLLAQAVRPEGAVPHVELEWKGWGLVDLPLRSPAPRPSIEIGGRRHFLYWGDLHVHSALSPDAEGDPDELMHYARDKSRLDVIVVQENDSNSWLRTAYADRRLLASEYALSVYYSRKYTRPGEFVALAGWEWSHRTDDNKPNHRTVMFAGADTPILRHTENGGRFDQLCDVVEAAGGLMFAQHEAFRLVNRPCDAALEVATGWGVYIQPPEKIHADLTAGFRVGFVATGDNHRRTPGYGGGITGIYAPELTPQAILDAVRERRVFATTGTRIALDARANGRPMGSTLEVPEAVELTLRAEAPEAIARATLVADGRELHTAEARDASRIETSFTDRPHKGSHWYYWRVELARATRSYGGNSKVAEGSLAWSSPHFVTVGAVEPGRRRK